jgi:regulatory protein
MDRIKRQHRQTRAPERSAYDKALRWLTHREHSQHELQRKLAQSGCAPEDSQEALQRLQRQQYQDDTRFAQALVRRRISQGYGPLRIAAELKNHDLADALIHPLLAQLEQDWDAWAAEQLHRHYGSRPVRDAAEYAKRLRFLLRRGFTGSSAHTALRRRAQDNEECADE